MKERGRAVLINALVFPGMGQLLVLERRVAGSLFVATSLFVLLVAGGSLGLRLHAALSDLDALVDPLGLLVVTLDVLKNPAWVEVSGLALLLLCWVFSILDAARISSPETSPQS